MKFNIVSWTIKDLIDNYNKKLINLNPPYQRNDIWSLPAKKRLIDSIIKGYPLPTFFLHQTEHGKFDCVDGQQRIRTLIGFINDLFPTLENKKYSDFEDKTKIIGYRIPLIIMEDVDESKGESMEDFYYRVNMYGSKLNRPEILKSKYFNNPFQNLIERISESEEFTSLTLFTDSRLNRMIDYDFIGELITILKEGIFDKKIAVDRLYDDESFTEDIAKQYERKFQEILNLLLEYNSQIYPIKETRFKQRNDFYTIFHFFYANLNLSPEVRKYFYRLLVLFKDDIKPSNEKCYAFQEYAFNCISQSNSKNARIARYEILSDILLNTDSKPLLKKEKDSKNSNLIDVLEFYNLSDDDLVEVNGYYLINVEKLKTLKPEINFIS